MSDGEGVPDGTVDPWGSRRNEPPTAREPLSRAPWQPVLLVGVLVALYMAQSFSGDPDGIANAFSFTPAELFNGHFFGLVTALFVHGSWSHVLFNSLFALAFCTPVARAVGPRGRGSALFFLLFLVCGLLGNLGYAIRHLSDLHPVIGASGGIAGFYGATSRMVGREKGLAPFWSPTVVSMGAAWIVMNVLVGLFGLNGGFGAPGASVAWEAHIAGYFAGLFLIGPFLRAAGGVRI